MNIVSFIGDFKNIGILEKITATLIFVFPVVALTVKNGGSIVVSLLFLLALVYGFRNIGEVQPSEKKLLVGFAIVFVVMALTLFNTEDIATGLKRLDRYFRWLAAIPVYFLVRKCSLRLQALVLGALVASLVIGIDTAHHLIVRPRPWIKAHGAYHHIIFGEYVTFLGFFLLAWLVGYAKSAKEKIASSVGAGLCFFAMVSSGARGAWLAFPFLLGYLLWCYRDRLSQKMLAGIGAILVVGLVVVSFTQVPDRITKIYSEYKYYSTVSKKRMSSTAGRLNMWKNSIAMFKKSPLLGTGIGDFANDTRKLIMEHKTDSHLVYDHAHSIYFDTLAVSGLIGFAVTFYFLFYFPLRYFWRGSGAQAGRRARLVGTSGTILILSYAIFGLSETWLIRNAALNVYIMFLLVLFAEQAKPGLGVSVSPGNSERPGS